MAFGNFSAIFNSWVYDKMYTTTGFTGSLSSTGWKAALFNNTGTPDNTAVSASCAYLAGAWVVGNEVTDATNWQAGGRAIAPTGSGVAASPPIPYVAQNFVMLDGLDTAGGGNVTLTNVYGDLVYESVITTPVNHQGICYHSYGGSPQGVTAGTFTVIWNTLGVARWTHTAA